MQRRRRRREQPLRFAFEPPPAPPGRPTEARRRRIRWVRVLLVLTLLGLLGTVSAFFGLMTAVAQQAPNLDQFTAKEPNQVGFIWAPSPGHPGAWVKIGVLRRGDARLILTPAQISPWMKKAIVAIEDRRFYEHKGFDPAGIARAALKRVVLGATEGGSTITQQLIKNLYLGPQQTIKRKFQEIVLAYQLERAWHSKPKILAAYLNTIYFGHGCYGIAAASQFYFGKPAAGLTIGESATLAAIPKSPTQYDPLRKPQETLARRNAVLDAMVAQGDISAAVAAAEKSKPLLGKTIEHQLDFGGTKVPYFVQYVTQQLVRRYGEQTALAGGLNVYTTIDLKLQKLAEKTVHDALKGVGPDGSLVAIEPSTGRVLALVGGPRYDKDHQFDIATDGHRQPGSAFKPFVLLAALARGIQPDTSFVSRKQFFDLGTNQPGLAVVNDTPDYTHLPMALPQAMTLSDNTVFAQLTQAVHPANVVKMAHALGINSPLDPNLAIGLGGLRVGVTPLEMAHAYATIANRGRRIGGSLLFHTPEAGYTSPTQDPISIDRIVFPDGRVEINHPASTTAVSETDALSALDTMRGVTQSSPDLGTGFRAAIPGRTVIGKTGTTSNNHDAWFVGMTPQLVTAVWVGFSRPARPMNNQYHGAAVFGGTFPAEIWRDFTTAALRHQPAEDWPNSPGRSQDTYAVDIFKEPYQLSSYDCRNVRALVMAVRQAPDVTEPSCDKRLTIVPLMTGYTRRQALQAADDQGLRFLYELVPARPGDAIGRVVSQIPDAAVRVHKGDPLLVYIAVDVPLVRVPDVTSHGTALVSVAEAVGRLHAMGFTVVIEDGQQSSSLPSGTVIGQDTQAAAPEPRGTVITIAVVGDAHAVVVPDYSGLTLAEVRLRFAAVGLHVTATRSVGGKSLATDVVVDANVRAGTQQVPAGSTVTVQTTPPGR